MGHASRLRCYMNLAAMGSMPASSNAPQGSIKHRFESLAAAGFHGVQFDGPGSPGELNHCRALKLGIASSGRVNVPSEASVLAESLAGDGYESATLHAGWGLEDDSEAHKLIDSILAASAKYRIPLYVETHRATIFQDMWRTVGFVWKFPDIRFNADFSHWYAGQEMVYGGFERKFAFIAPVLERVRFVHGRIANPGCIQVPVQADAVYVDHFRRLWIAAFGGFLRDPDAPDHICFTPELLGPDIYYARTLHEVEESDRWEQSLILNQMAEDCFACAQSS